MKHRSAFTMFELLISLTISIFVITGFIQAQRMAVRYLERTAVMLSNNRVATLALHQLERDVSSAHIPIEHERIVPTQQKDGNEPKGADDKQDQKDSDEAVKKEEQKKTTGADEQKGNQKKEKEDPRFFVLESDHDAVTKVDDVPHYLFTSATWITTTPLQVYGEEKVRRIRVGYRLEMAKRVKEDEKITYNLYRLETYDLENYQLKQKEGEEDLSKAITKELVAHNIKEMHLQGFLPPKRKKDGKKEPAAGLFDWGGKRETQFGRLPEKVVLRIVFSGKDMTDDPLFTATYSPATFFDSEWTWQEALKKEQEEKDKETNQKSDGNEK